MLCSFLPDASSVPAAEMNENSMLLLPECIAPPEPMPTQSKSPYNELNRWNNEIRLIRVLPTTSDNTLCCETTTYALQNAPSYTALSYTWGRPGGGRPIRLDGHVVQVRVNLWRFLHEIRDHIDYQGRFLWIDALCIDQSNHRERTHQVGMMSRIYQGAKDVTIWLGPAYTDSKTAMKIFEKKSMAKNSKKLWKRPMDAAIVHQFCERRYWSRLWVVQEIVLAREITILCGSSQLRWADFENFIVVSKSMIALPDEARSQYDLTMTSSAARMIHQVSQARGTTSLFNQVIASAKLGCSDARDKIYGVLGVVGAGHEIILPDYTMTMPALLNKVLRNEFVSNPPQDLGDVRRRCEELASSVGVEVGVLFSDDRAAEELGISDVQDVILTPLLCQDVGFWWSCFYEHTSVKRLWLDTARPELLDDALLSAAKLGHEETCLFLLREGEGKFDAHHADQHSHTALWYASQYGCERFVTSLLTSKNLRVNQGEKGLTSALHNAIEHGQNAVALTLIHDPRTNVLPDTLELAVRCGNEHHARRMLEEGHTRILEWNSCYEGCVPLTFAVEHEHHAISRLLFAHLALELGLGDTIHDHGLTVAEATSQTYFNIALRLIQILDPGQLRHLKIERGLLLREAVYRAKWPVVHFILRISELSEGITKDRHFEEALNSAIEQGKDPISQALLEMPGADEILANNKKLLPYKKPSSPSG